MKITILIFLQKHPKNILSPSKIFYLKLYPIFSPFIVQINFSSLLLPLSFLLPPPTSLFLLLLPLPPSSFFQTQPCKHMTQKKRNSISETLRSIESALSPPQNKQNSTPPKIKDVLKECSSRLFSGKKGENDDYVLKHLNFYTNFFNGGNNERSSNLGEKKSKYCLYCYKCF